MAKTVSLEKISSIVPSILSMPSKMMWIDYDEDADVLYINFEKPQNATESEMIDDIITHFRKGKVVGITVLHASNYLKS